LACSAFHHGNFEKAIEHARRGLAHYRPEAPNQEYARHGVDTGILCHGWAAFASWFLGRSGDAFVHIEESEAATRGQPYACATSRVVSATLHQYRDEPVAVRKWADAVVALASEHGYPFRLAQGRIMHGWAVAATGEDEDGLAELRAGLEAYRSSGAFVEWPYFTGLLADALLRTGDPVRALDHVTEALAAAEGRPGFFYAPELHRLRAAALLALGSGGAVDEARAAIRRALELAGTLGSPATRLRVLLTSQLVAEDGDRAQLCRDVRSTLASFPEDDEAPDLVRGRAV
jgi:tetratricopeptide (TPR) repeat protein